MSGVKVGTRLEQLERLQERIRQEIAVERRRLFLEGRERPHSATKAPRTNAVDHQLVALRVSAREVKEWALAEGLIEEIKRGRVSSELVDAYQLAHREESP